MAHHDSAKKAIRKTITRTSQNRSNRSRIRTYIKKVEEAIASGNKENANSLFQEVQSELSRGASKGIIHLKTASRKISRLCAKVKAIA